MNPNKGSHNRFLTIFDSFPLQQWREGFRRYKLLSKIEEDDEDIRTSVPAAEAILAETSNFDDDSSEYIEYLSNRFTYY